MCTALYGVFTEDLVLYETVFTEDLVFYKSVFTEDLVL
jgi:hypothetical protein